MKTTYKILSVGGSILIPKTGFDILFLKKFRKLILEQVKKGQRFVLIIGGGATCRNYQTTLAHVVSPTVEELDILGIQATHFNAEFVRLLFKDFAAPDVIKDPTKKISTTKPVIIAGGWKPGHSTDAVAVQLVKKFKVKELYNLSNIDYIYTSDPAKNSKAKKIETMNWDELQKIVGTKWHPGLHAPFDPVAITRAKKLKLKAYFVKGTDLKQVKNALQGKKCFGTIIR
jgi:uridylate kinase